MDITLTIFFHFHDYETEYLARDTDKQRKLTPPLHLILPIILWRFVRWTAPWIIYLFFGCLSLNTVSNYNISIFY